MIYHGDCLEILKTLPDNSVDAVITDPPYGLSFMGKKWDYDVPSVEIWQECLRVLKHGGYVLSFAGTRTQHRMAVRIEDAGFEIRDMIFWTYASGFPKSLNVGVAVNKLETKEWSAIGKALDNIDKKNIIEVWKSNSNNVKIVETQSLKLKEKAGCNTPSENFVQENVVENTNQIKLSLNVNTAEKHFIVLQAIHTEESTVLQNAEKIITEISELQNLVTTAENSQQSDNAMQSMNIFTAQCDVKEWLNENTEVSHKVDEALKTLRGNKKYSNEEITSVLCAVIPSVLKLTILNQSKTFQNLDTNQKMECVSAINVIITEYTAENLISNMVDILKSKAVDKLRGNEREDYEADIAYPDSDCWGIPNRNSKGTKGMFLDAGKVSANGKVKRSRGTSPWEGWGTALKPSVEPLTVARKPLEKGLTVAENCLKWGVGGINIDGCRVGTEEHEVGMAGRKADFWACSDNKKMTVNKIVAGRFPANLIHDGSQEVLDLFPNTKSVRSKRGGVVDSGDTYSLNWKEKETYECGFNDSGSAARFFKQIPLDNDTLSCYLCGKDINKEDLCKNTPVHNAETNLTTIKGTILSTVPQDVIGNLNGKLDHFVKYVGTLCEKCGTSFVQNLVVISEVRRDAQSLETLQVMRDFTTNSKKCILLQNLANYAVLMESIDTTPTTINLLKLFGSANLAITNYIQEIEKNAPKRFLYTPKASKAERNRGCEGLEAKDRVNYGGFHSEQGLINNHRNPENRKPTTNNHPTVKPIALMEYLVKLVTREGQTVLDPFAGSGTTGIACKNLNRNAILIEREAEYVEIAKRRIAVNQ